MDRFIGLDVHMTSCTVAVVSASGKRLRDFPVETHGEALIDAVRSVAGKRHLVLEEGTQSAWLYDLLRPHVHELVVTSVRGGRGPKSDAKDAYGLAEKLRTGGLDRVVFKAPAEFRTLRELATVHRALTGDLVRVRLRIKSQFRSRGIASPGQAVYGKRNREEWLAKLPASHRRSTERLYAHLDFLVDLKAEAEKDLVKESHRHPIARVLETAPGMGPIRVARLLPVVITPHRFRTKRQFWSYCGLSVVTRSSSDWVQSDRGWVRVPVQQSRGLTREHNRVLKDVFKGAATTVVTQGGDDPLYQAYRELASNGTKPNLAKLTLARRIAGTVLRMWKDEEVYQPERVLSAG
jgi:transposase